MISHKYTRLSMQNTLYLVQQDNGKRSKKVKWKERIFHRSHLIDCNLNHKNNESNVFSHSTLKRKFSCRCCHSSLLNLIWKKSCYWCIFLPLGILLHTFRVNKLTASDAPHTRKLSHCMYGSEWSDQPALQSRLIEPFIAHTNSTQSSV